MTRSSCLGILVSLSTVLTFCSLGEGSIPTTARRRRREGHHDRLRRLVVRQSEGHHDRLRPLVVRHSEGHHDRLRRLVVRQSEGHHDRQVSEEDILIAIWYKILPKVCNKYC